MIRFLIRATCLARPQAAPERRASSHRIPPLHTLVETATTRGLPLHPPPRAATAQRAPTAPQHA